MEGRVLEVGARVRRKNEHQCCVIGKLQAGVLLFEGKMKIIRNKKAQNQICWLTMTAKNKEKKGSLGCKKDNMSTIYSIEDRVTSRSNFFLTNLGGTSTATEKFEDTATSVRPVSKTAGFTTRHSWTARE